MSSWKLYQLGELYDVSSGLSISKDSFGYGEIFISFKDVFYNWFLPSEPAERVNSSEKDQLTCSILKGDVLITRTSETSEEIGMTSVALKDYPKSTFNGFCKRLRIKPDAPIEISPSFIGYLFRSRNFRKTVAQYSTMTTRASLNAASIKRMSFLFPTFEEQKGIANILSAFDDKINNLQEQNKTLEQIAQTIFAEWFGKYQAGDELPNGWRVGKIEEIIERFPISYRCTKSDIDENGKTPIFDQGKDGLYGYTDREPDFQASRENPVVLFTNHTCNYWYVDYPFCAIQNVLPYRGKNGYETSFVYFLTKGSVNFIEYKGHWPNLASKDFIFPTTELAKQFSDIADSTLDKISENNTQIQSLIQTRDTLLPKLMSGQLRVKMSEL